jgi:hypothetical protein
MALVFKDRVRERTNTIGQDSLVLLGAFPGYQTFSTIGSGNSTYYAVIGNEQWEVGIGTYSSNNTLSRNTILASSSNDAKVSFITGMKEVFITYPSKKMISYNEVDNVGIGTAQPSAKLHIVGTSTGYNGTPQLRIGEIGSNLSIAKQLLIGYDTTNNKGFIQATQWNTSNTNLILQPAGGNVGIGTVLPTQALDVVGAINTSGGVLPRVAESRIYSSWDSSNTDFVSITAQTGVVVIGADNGGARAYNGQKVTFRVVGGVGGCTITFDSGADYKFKGVGITLPLDASLVEGATLILSAIYNANNMRWEVISLVQD